MKLVLNKRTFHAAALLAGSLSLVACLPADDVDDIVDNTETPVVPTCETTASLFLVGADDEGHYDGENGPDNAIDNDPINTRWSADGANRWLTVDLGGTAIATDIEVSYYSDHKRTSDFYIQTSMDNLEWTTVSDLITTAQPDNSGPTPQKFEITNSEARYVRLVGQGNSDSGWNSITDFQVYGCSDMITTKAAVEAAKAEIGTDPYDEVNFLQLAIDNNRTPAENFDLSKWYISVATPDTSKDPITFNEDGSPDEYPATSISLEELNGYDLDSDTLDKSAGYTSPGVFETADDGGMVFTVMTNGARTSTNTNYTRTELRGMLRGYGKEDDPASALQGVTKNNWVFGYTSDEAKAAAGGVNGVMRATLAVNQVSELPVGNSKTGKVIIGQIHANDDEPLRIYYQKHVNNSVGAVYMAHEAESSTLNGEIKYDLIGKQSWTDSSNPSADEGIALGEVFSYEVRVKDNLLLVTIYKRGQDPVTQVVTMYESGYDNPNQYMYFKAGVYNQNDKSDSKKANGGLGEPVTATFYHLETSHD